MALARSAGIRPTETCPDGFRKKASMLAGADGGETASAGGMRDLRIGGFIVGFGSLIRVTSAPEPGGVCATQAAPGL